MNYYRLNCGIANKDITNKTNNYDGIPSNYRCCV